MLVWIVHDGRASKHQRGTGVLRHQRQRQAPSGACFQRALRTPGSVAEIAWAPSIVCSSSTATLLELDGSVRLPFNAQQQMQELLSARSPERTCSTAVEDTVVFAVIADWFARQSLDTLQSLDVARVPSPTKSGRPVPIWSAAKMQMREAILRLWDADADAARNAAPAASSVQAPHSSRIPRIAVISYGQVRATDGGWFERSFDATRRYVLQPLAPWALLFADYNCQPGACSADSVRKVLGRNATSLCMTADPPWARIYKLDQAMCNWTKQMSKSKETRATRLANRHYYLMGMWSLQRAILAVEERRTALGIGSTVITRIDTLFFSPGLAPLLLQRPWDEPGRIFVPKTGNFGFLSDQFAYGCTDVMRRFVRERAALAMGTCHAQMSPEPIACHVASENHWNVSTSVARFVRLRANWEVPHRDIINAFPGIAHRCCGDTLMARVRALPAMTRLSPSRKCLQMQPRPIPTDMQLKLAQRFLSEGGGSDQCSGSET